MIHDEPKRAEIAPYIRNCKSVAYWLLYENDKDGNPKIVGIIWHINGSKKLFLARIPPP